MGKRQATPQSLNSKLYHMQKKMGSDQMAARKYDTDVKCVHRQRNHMKGLKKSSKINVHILRKEM